MGHAEVPRVRSGPGIPDQRAAAGRRADCLDQGIEVGSGEKGMTAKEKTAPPGAGVKVNPYTLSFSGEAERRYIEHYYQKSIRQIRIALALVLILWSAAGIKDGWLAPEAKAGLSFIRFAVF